eukprot:gene40602-14717_t
MPDTQHVEDRSAHVRSTGDPSIDPPPSQGSASSANPLPARRVTPKAPPLPRLITPARRVRPQRHKLSRRTTCRSTRAGTAGWRRQHRLRLWSVRWSLSARARNKRMHALNGNIYHGQSSQGSARPCLRPGDFMCANCNGHNYSRRTNCYNCNAPRPPGNPPQATTMPQQGGPPYPPNAYAQMPAQQLPPPGNSYGSYGGAGAAVQPPAPAQQFAPPPQAQQYAPPPAQQCAPPPAQQYAPPPAQHPPAPPAGNNYGGFGGHGGSEQLPFGDPPDTRPDPTDPDNGEEYTYDEFERFFGSSDVKKRWRQAGRLLKKRSRRTTSPHQQGSGGGKKKGKRNGKGGKGDKGRGKEEKKVSFSAVEKLKEKAREAEKLVGSLERRLESKGRRLTKLEEQTEKTRAEQTATAIELEDAKQAAASARTAADAAERDGDTSPIDVDDTDTPIPPESLTAALQRIQEQAAAMARMQEQGNALIVQLAQLQTQLGEQVAGRVAAEEADAGPGDGGAAAAAAPPPHSPPPPPAGEKGKEKEKDNRKTPPRDRGRSRSRSGGERGERPRRDGDRARRDRGAPSPVKAADLKDLQEKTEKELEQIAKTHSIDIRACPPNGNPGRKAALIGKIAAKHPRPPPSADSPAGNSVKKQRDNTTPKKSPKANAGSPPSPSPSCPPPPSLSPLPQTGDGARLRRPCGLLALRVGEAANPGPGKKKKAPTRYYEKEYAHGAEVREQDRLELLATGGENTTAVVWIGAPDEVWHRIYTGSSVVPCHQSKDQTGRRCDPRWTPPTGKPLPPWGKDEIHIPKDSPLLSTLSPGNSEHVKHGNILARSAKGITVGGKVIFKYRYLCIFTAGQSPRRSLTAVKLLPLFPPQTKIILNFKPGDSSKGTYKVEWGQGPAAQLQKDLELKLRNMSPDRTSGRLTVHSSRTADAELKTAEWKKKTKELQDKFGLFNNPACARDARAKEMKKWKRGIEAEKKAKKVSTPSKNTLRIMQWNCAGVRNRQVDLARLMEQYEPHVVMLQETHLNDAHDVPKSLLAGYNMIRKDGPTLPKDLARHQDTQGGLLVLLRDGLQWTKDLERKVCDKHDKETEVIPFTVIPHRSPPIPMIDIYIPCATSLRWQRSRSIFSPDPLPCDTLICADANAHHEDWDKEAVPCKRGRMIRQWAAREGVCILNDGTSTRLGSGGGIIGGHTAPDITLAPPRLKDATWTVLDDKGGSDHSPIVIDIQLPHPPVRRQKPQAKWAFPKADWTTFRTETESSLKGFAEARKGASPSALNEDLTKAILSAANKAIPKGHGRPSPKAWWSPEVEKIVQLRAQARRAAQRTGKPEDVARFNHLRRQADRVTRKARAESWQRYASELNMHSDARAIHATVDHMKGKDSKKQAFRSLPALQDGNRVVTDCKGKAELLCKRYAAVCRLGTTDPGAERRLKAEIQSRLRERDPTPTQPMPAEMLKDMQDLTSPFTMADLLPIIRHLRKRKAAGADGVANEMLIHLGPSGLEALLHTINASWRTARVPGAWRCADIVPVLKKNKDPSLPKAYRPVCLTSCIAKTAERLVRLRTQHIIEKWRLLNHEQAGFRRGRSAEEQLAWTTQTISDALERG